jgi:hypothetical protein
MKMKTQDLKKSLNLTVFGMVFNGLKITNNLALGEQRKTDIMWVKSCLEKASSNA